MWRVKCRERKVGRDRNLGDKMLGKNDWRWGGREINVGRGRRDNNMFERFKWSKMRKFS
jgi:hypothetical protein